MRLDDFGGERPRTRACRFVCILRKLAARAVSPSQLSENLYRTRVEMLRDELSGGLRLSHGLFAIGINPFGGHSSKGLEQHHELLVHVRLSLV